MYGLPQAGILANKLLAKRLAIHGYAPTVHTPGLWKHRTCPILFSLVVNNFGVKYMGKQHADHLFSALEQHYEAATDWEGKLYCGLTLDWDYKVRTINISMPGYVAAALHQFQHKTPRQPCHTPLQWSQPIYGAKVQLTDPIDSTSKMTQDQTKLCQQVVGNFLFYACAVNTTMLHALNLLSAAQTKGTQQTVAALVHLLIYCATHLDAKIRYHACGMILHIHSDASYLSESEARSQAGGHHYLSDKPSPKTPPPNGPILNIAKILHHVMSSTAKAKLGALFLNAKEGTVLRTALKEMGHPQSAMPLQTNNSTANRISNGTCKQCQFQAIDMWFYWVHDQTQQGHFNIFWAPGTDNLADYFTKHHSPAHHRHMRPIVFNDPKHHHFLRGCVNPPIQPKLTRMLVRPSSACHQKAMTFNHTSRARQ
jgi:hypothetical protein